jgi:hypothetical protein
MNVDKRKAKSIIYIGEGRKHPRQVAEVGDEATLYHNGNLVMAKITSTQWNQIVGMITRSAYHPDSIQTILLVKRYAFWRKTFLRYLN